MHKISTIVLAWYRKKNITLPWRKNRNAYRTWISEIMLQQTQVNTAIPYFNKWFIRFPDISTLANSHLDDVLKIWEGLGYYSRAKHIHETSKIIQTKYNGEIPSEYNKLIELKGIGDYTASAILSMQFKQMQPAVDGNIKRVLVRIFGIKQHKRTLKYYKTYLLEILPKKNPGDMNQALMDIGRTICKPKTPICIDCPINKFCYATLKNQISKFSIRKDIKLKPKYNVSVGIIIKNNQFLISKRLPKGLLANLWELPGGKIKNNESDVNALIREVKEEVNISISNIKKIGNVKHEYSHFSVDIKLFYCEYLKGVIQPLASQKLKWINYSEIKKYSFPKSTHKLFKLYNEYNSKD